MPEWYRIAALWDAGIRGSLNAVLAKGTLLAPGEESSHGCYQA